MDIGGTARCLSPKLADVFGDIRRVVSLLPDEMAFDEVPVHGMKTDFELAPVMKAPSIHLLADAFARKFSLVAHHGAVHIPTKKGTQVHEHAWVSLKKDLEDFIIDIRPVGMDNAPMILLNHASRSFVTTRFVQPERYRMHLDVVSAHICKFTK